MIYCKTIEVERIAVQSINDLINMQFIELTKYGDESIFSVWTDDGKEEWYWEFDMTYPSNYERVKLSIYDAIFACNTMLELVEVLDEIFNVSFEGILISDEYEEYANCECHKNCEYLQ